MRKLISMILAAALLLCLASALAEQEDNFLVSDWKLVYTFGGMEIEGQTIFIYEDNTYEVMDADESKKGTWTFDGETLVLTADGESLSLLWDGETRSFTGEFNGMKLTMTVPVQPEDGGEAAGAPAGGALAGGWTMAEDPAITEEISTMLWQALDLYQTGTITVSYTPVAYLGSQVVAGTNHAILCRSQEINQRPVWVIVYLYQDLENNVSVLDIAELPLGV